MRIFIWCPAISIGGGGRLLINLLAALERRSDVDYIRLITSASTQLKERTTHLGLTKLAVFYHERFDSIVLHALGWDCDISYCFWPHLIPFANAGPPSVCTFHDTIVFNYPPPFTTGQIVCAAWKVAKTWMDNCNRIVVSSRHVYNCIQSHFGTGVSPSIIRHAVSPLPMFDETNIRPQGLPEKYLIYPANLAPHKNHYNLLQAYARFSQKESYPLILFGYQTEQLRIEPPNWPNESYLPTLTALIHRLGLKLDHNIYPLGFVEDSMVSRIIANAAALIMPSVDEGGGSYPVEEALSLGVPVACSDIPVMREQLVNHSADIAWFNPHSPDSITAALEDLAVNYAHYKNSAEEGRSDVHYTWDDVATQYMNVFREIAART